MGKEGLYKARLLELISETSSALPEDVLAALRKAAATAESGSAEATALATMLENASLAKERRLPVCQDTGSLLFYIDAPSGFDTLSFEEDARAAEIPFPIPCSVINSPNHINITEPAVIAVTDSAQSPNVGVKSLAIFADKVD